ncbi:MAG: HXXEE domain-containing protein [Spirochaetes bacterium]|nr:HXXEE domain-containing protein [Spirochaetota bacterium]
MNQLSSFINSVNVIWLIPVLFSIHELEEWNILNWYKKYYADLPASTNTSIRIHILTISLAAILLTFIAWISPIIIRSIIVIFLTGFILTNTIQHVIWTFQYKAYAPGLTTAILCMIIFTLVNIILVKNEMILVPIYLILLPGIPTVIKTVKSKHQMTPEIRRLHELFIKAERYLRGENRTNNA